MLRRVADGGSGDYERETCYLCLKSWQTTIAFVPFAIIFFHSDGLFASFDGALLGMVFIASLRCGMSQKSRLQC